VRLPGGNLEVLFSDTVGFIQKLPTQLVAAFRATLEEIASASVVLHVLDVSADNAPAQCAAVLQVRAFLWYLMRACCFRLQQGREEDEQGRA
jgi:GTP-binding protein HflX